MKDSFKYQTAMDQHDLAAYFHALAEAVERGELPLAEGERGFCLCPRGLLNLVIKARRKEGRSRVLFDISWAEDAPYTPLLDDLERGEGESA